MAAAGGERAAADKEPTLQSLAPERAVIADLSLASMNRRARSPCGPDGPTSVSDSSRLTKQNYLKMKSWVIFFDMSAVGRKREGGEGAREGRE